LRDELFIYNITAPATTAALATDTAAAIPGDSENKDTALSMKP